MNRVLKQELLEQREADRASYSYSEDTSPRPTPPPSALFLCSFRVEAAPHRDVELRIRFQRDGRIDRAYVDGQLWAKAERATEGTINESIAVLLPIVLQGLVTHMGRIGEFCSAGMIDEPQFAVILSAYLFDRERTLEANSQHANARIVVAAAELGLDPAPDAEQKGFWRARCPGTKHRLLLNIERNEYWCGYCKRNGSVSSLEAFAGERIA